MSYEMKDGTTVEDPRLGRLVQFDEQSKGFPVIRTLTPRQLEQPRSYTWAVGQWLNQGREGACVAFGISHELIARPVRVTGVDDAFAQRHYCEIQAEDPWPGGSCPGMTPSYDGTSVLSGVKHFTRLGFYSSYHWAFSEEALMLAVGHKGPAIIGVNWYEGMFEPNSNGYISVSGSVQGGHCTLVFGVNVKAGYYRIWNSWGPDWGQRGTCKITRADMAKLLKEEGECCIPDSRHLV